LDTRFTVGPSRERAATLAEKKRLPQAYQTSQYAVPRGGIFLGKVQIFGNNYKGLSTLLVLVLVGRLAWFLLVLVNRRPHYFSCSPGFGA
jgi:hypothetical protein